MNLSKSSPSFVVDSGDIAGLGDKVTKAVLIGSASFVSMSELGMENYAPVEPRSSMSGFKRLYDRNQKKVYFAINEDILVAASNRIQFAFAYDALLKWGYSTKGNTILLGGISTAETTYMQVFVFQNGDLVQTEERELSASDSPYYEETALSIIDDLQSKFPESKVYYAAPLPKFSDSVKQLNYLSEDIYKSLTYQKLGITTNRAKPSLILPLGVILASTVALSLLLFKGWTEYNNAVEAFNTAMSDPVVKMDGGVGGNFVDKVGRQRAFMLAPRYQIELNSKTTQLVTAATRVPNARIISLQVISPSLTTEGGANIQIILAVPGSNRLALEQGKEMLDIISSKAGISLHMASSQGWKDIEKIRQFTFEGNLTQEALVEASSNQSKPAQ